MSMLEDRLTAAMTARTDLVRLEDLRPADPPTRRTHPWRRPALYGLAAAACAAAIAAPFVLGGGPGDDAPDVPPATRTPSESPTAAPPTDWPVIDSWRSLDVDGDGARDVLVTQNASGEELSLEEWRVQVRFATGSFATYPVGRHVSVNLVDPVDVDGDGADEILIYNGEEKHELMVLRHDGLGGLTGLRIPDDPGLTSAPDARYRSRGWWIEDGRLFSYRTVEGGFVPGTSNASPPPYEVDIWRWDVGPNDRLVPVAMPSGCLDETVDRAPSTC